jgi:hypothetical protein
MTPNSDLDGRPCRMARTVIERRRRRRRHGRGGQEAFFFDIVLLLARTCSIQTHNSSSDAVISNGI